MRSLLPAAIFAALVSCRDAPKPLDAGASIAAPAWPELPRTADASAALIQSATLRKAPESDRAIDDKRILEALATHGWSTFVAGNARVITEIDRRLDRHIARGRDALLIFGTFHDSAGQVDAFRRLMGPGGLANLSLVAVEPLWGSGAWQGAAGLDQRGDDEALARYLATGDPAAHAALTEAQRDHDYAAWKFDYVPAVLDLAVAARARGVPLIGCDMPRSLAEATHADRERGDFDRLREIHCSNALKSAFARAEIARPRRVAMMWGQAHATAKGMRRFFAEGDTGALSVFAFGHREGDWTVEAAVGKSVCVSDPILVPLADDELALLLPDRAIGCEVDRVARAREGDARPPLLARSTVKGALSIDGNAASVDAAPRSIELGAGDHIYAFEAPGLTMLGAITLRPGASAELSFDPPRRAVAITYIEPKR